MAKSHNPHRGFDSSPDVHIEDPVEAHGGHASAYPLEVAPRRRLRI